MRPASSRQNYLPFLALPFLGTAAASIALAEEEDTKASAELEGPDFEDIFTQITGKDNIRDTLKLKKSKFIYFFDSTSVTD